MNHNYYSLFSLFGLNAIYIEAYPLPVENEQVTGTFYNFNSFYISILVALVLSILCLVGCLCCKWKKGFQEFSPRSSRNNAGNIEFSNPLSTCNPQSEITLFPPPGSTPITFDPLPPLTPKHQQLPIANPRPAAFTDALAKGISVESWFQEPQDNFPRQQLHYLRECGRGWFGRVVEGEARGILPNGRTSRVIVRILREEATESEQKFFLHEAKPYMELSHPNLLRLLGRCLENDPFLLLFEACNGGDLKSWLTQNVASRETLTQQGITMRMATDIASGLAHLNHHGFFHTDLAARNVLVTSDLRVKVGDYGASIETFKDDYYCTGEVALPIRWCAPETLQCTDTTIETKEVTAPANVWSFGVVLWEICEFGKLPYTDLSDDQVIVHVLGNEQIRLPEPSFPSPFKNHLYYLMQLCWRPHKERPSISHILSMLNHLLTSKIKTQIDMDNFERRWEKMKPNTVPKTDNHTPTMNEERVKSDSDSGVVLDNKQTAGSEIDLSSKKLLTDMTSSSSMTISPQLSVTSSSGGEFFSQTSTPMKLKSPSLQDLQGSLDDIQEAVNRSVNLSSSNEAPSLNLWLQNIEIKNEKDAKLVSGVYKAINDLDNALSLEKTSSSNDSSCYDSPSSNRKSVETSNQNPVLDFRLGPFVNNNFHLDRRLRFQDSFQDDSFLLKRTGDSSGTDTEDEMWRRRIEKGEFSEKVKEKSKSIADLMVLTHIDNSDGSETDSIPMFNFSKTVRQNTRNNALMNSIGFGSDICIYSSLTAEQSDSDLKKFQDALKKKDMDNPSLNFLRRDSLSYFINNSNFKYSDSGPNSSSNFHPPDHFLEISASEKTTKPTEDFGHLTVSTPEILVSNCSVNEDESPNDEPNISLDLEAKKFKFVFKDKFPDETVDEEKNVNDVILENPLFKSDCLNDAKNSNVLISKMKEELMSKFDLVDSGILIDEQPETSQFILPLSSELNTKSSSVILGSCEDFTLDYFKGLKTSSGSELNTSEENKVKKENEVVTQWTEIKSNKLDEKSQTNISSNLMNGNNVDCDKSLRNSDEILSENYEDSDNFVPENNSSINCQNRFFEEHSDDAFIDSGKSSDVLDDENYDVKPYSSFHDLINHGYQNLEAKTKDNGVNENEPSLTSGYNYSESYDHIMVASNEDLDGLKATTPDDENSCDTGFRDKSSLSESCDDVCDEKYNLEDIENELDDIQPLSYIYQPEFMNKIENKSEENFKENTAKNTMDESSFYCCYEKSKLKKDNNFNYDKNVLTLQNDVVSIKENEIRSDDVSQLHQTKVPNLLCDFEGNHDTVITSEDEDLPPSYDECERLHGPDFQMLGLKGEEQRSDISDLVVDENKMLEGSKSRTAEGNSDLNSENQNEMIKYAQNCTLNDEFTVENATKTDSDDETEDVVYEKHLGGWYLHSRPSENAPDEEKDLENSWLPESMVSDEETVPNEELNEEFLNAIRNELNEKLLKLPHASTSAENDEGSDDDNSFDDDLLTDNQDNIFIQYNNYPKYLSPILEENESNCSSASSLASFGDFSHSTQTLSPRNNESEIIDNMFDFINDPLPDSFDRKDGENDDVIEVNTETNEIRIIESPSHKLQSSIVSPADKDPVNELFETADQSSEYSPDSISPVTGSPSTNLNALSFSSMNENLSEVFQSPSSIKSDITFADDKTLCSEPLHDNETNSEDSDEDCFSPAKDSQKTNHTLNETFTIDSEDLYSTAAESVNSLLSNSCEQQDELEKVNDPVQESQLKTCEASVLLHQENSSPNLIEEVKDNKVTSTFHLSSSSPSTENSTTRNLKENLKSPSEAFTCYDAENEVKCDVFNVNQSKIQELEPEIRALNKKDNTDKETELLKTNLKEFENPSFTLNHSTPIKNAELHSTLALESHIDDSHLFAKENDDSSSDDGKINSNGTLCSVTNFDSEENYKNYCRKKFKITKVDEDNKPILFNDSNHHPKNNSQRNSDKGLLCDIELNRRLSEINKEAQERLEISVQTSEPNIPMPSPSEKDDLTMSSSWPVSSQFFQSENLKTLGLAEIDASDDQMMSTSFIDSNSAENSDLEENSESNTEWDERDLQKELRSKNSDLLWNQIYENTTNFNVPCRKKYDDLEAEAGEDEDDDFDDEDDEDIADFVPSSWNSLATPNKSALKSPEPKSESKKNVSFKRQRYHCVYEYPREEHSDTEEDLILQSSHYSTPINFDYSQYAEWEMSLADDVSSCETPQEPETETVKTPEEKHDVYSLTSVDQEFSFNSMLEDEFFISSSARPFKSDQIPLNCQFFPGKTFLEENFQPLAADIAEDKSSSKT